MNEPVRAPEARFTPTVLVVTGGLLIWIANFVFIYSFVAVACARGFAQVQVGPFGIVPVVVVVASAACAFATAMLLRRAIRNRSDGDNARFTRFTTVATCAIALVAFVFVVLPVLLVPGCER